MRVLITTQPESGHWHPLVPLARALNTAGHDVAFASTPAGSIAIAANSLRCFSLGTDSTQEELAAQGERLGTLLPGDRVAAFWAEIFAGTRATRVLPDLLAVCHEWRPTLIVREYMEFAGCVAAERMGLPHAAVQISAWRPWLQPLLAAPLDRLRDSVYLPSDPDLAMP